MNGTAQCLEDSGVAPWGSEKMAICLRMFRWLHHTYAGAHPLREFFMPAESQEPKEHQPATERKFDWDNSNTQHIAEHNVAPEEAEEVVLGDSLDIGFNVVDGEERWSYLGETNDGRILWVAITLRGKRMRVVTAFEPERHWKAFYLEKMAGLQ
jgi:uncharacterized protein